MDNSFFNENGYLIIRGALNEQTLQLLKNEIKITEKIMCFKKNKRVEEHFFKDNQCENSFSYYSLLGTEALLQLCSPIIEEKTNLKLIPTYSYFRIYYNNSILNKHTDRDACEISVSVCISKDVNINWPLYFEDKNKKEVSVDLSEGDMVIYMGNTLIHWRNKFEGEQHIQAFLHYVNKYGDKSHLKYDGRLFLGF